MRKIKCPYCDNKMIVDEIGDTGKKIIDTKNKTLQECEQIMIAKGYW